MIRKPSINDIPDHSNAKSGGCNDPRWRNCENIITHSAEREAVCEKHGVYTSKFYMGRIWSKCGTCAAEEAKLHAEREAAEQAEKDRRKLHGCLALLASLTAFRIVH